MNRIRISSADTERHYPYFQFIDTIFPGARTETWTSWRDRGGWTSDYDVFAVLDDDRIVATIGRSRMHLLIESEPQTGYQLGAVATHEGHRGQGLARRLMEWVIDSLDTADQPILLFANDGVLDFYPRFGFERRDQCHSIATSAHSPAEPRAPRYDLSNDAQRLHLQALCARARPPEGNLTARDYYWLALWNLATEPITLSWLAEQDAAVAFAIEGETLVIHDILTTAPFDLAPLIPTLLDRPVTKVVLLIDHEGFWPTMRHVASDAGGSTLFLRGTAAAAPGPVQFTPLART